MTCRELEDLLTLDLSAGEREDVRLHLKQCSCCRRLHKDLLAIEELTSELSRSTEIRCDISESVLGCSRRRALLWPLFRMLVPAAGLVTILLLTVIAAKWWPGLFGKGDHLTAHRAVQESPVMVPVELESRYVEILHESQGEASYILRLPATIEIHRTELDSDFYLNHVSH